MTLLISGALCAAYAVTALFFLRFWVRTRDRFFAGFSIAFWLMAVQEMVASLAKSSHGAEEPRDYLLRLLAFLIIIVAVLDKNAAGAPPSRK